MVWRFWHVPLFYIYIWVIEFSNDYSLMWQNCNNAHVSRSTLLTFSWLGSQVRPLGDIVSNPSGFKPGTRCTCHAISVLESTNTCLVDIQFVIGTSRFANVIIYMRLCSEKADSSFHLSVVQHSSDPVVTAIVPDKILSKAQKKLSRHSFISMNICHIFHHRPAI